MGRCCLLFSGTRSAPRNSTRFAAQYPAHGLPCERFTSALGIRPVSQLNTQLMVSPVNASRQPSRTAAHHSGPERLARPCSVVDFHLLSFASLSWRSPPRVISGRQGRALTTSGIRGKAVENCPNFRLLPETHRRGRHPATAGPSHESTFSQFPGHVKSFIIRR
jgi:hypothetical protein